MKNPNQAEVKTAKNRPTAPEQNGIKPRADGVARMLAAESPLNGNDRFAFQLANIGDTMEPEIPVDSIVCVCKREDMEPCSGELVLGLLKTGHAIFGIFHTPDHRPKMGLWQIRCINPKYPPAHYLPSHFHWLHPVEHIRVLGDDGYVTAYKTLEYNIGDETLDGVFADDL